MHVLSVNVGLPREVLYKGRCIVTGIFKRPVGGAVMIKHLHLEGDGQADLSVHGGVNKAVYFYPFEHYAFWKSALPAAHLSPGSFGENLTIEGIVETQICIGDRLQVGQAVLRITQPRIPCYKLNIRFDRPDMVRRFLASQRCGFYAAVEKEGPVQAGNLIQWVDRAPHGITVHHFIRWFTTDKRDWRDMQRALSIKDLPGFWQKYFQTQIEKWHR